MRGVGLKLAAFTAFTVFVTFWLASLIGNIQPFTRNYTINAVFSDAAGLLIGDLVKIAGVDVGKVTSFEGQHGYALVTMQIEGSVKLPENTNAEIRFRNLLGQRIVNLSPGENPSGTLTDGETIPVTNTTPALDLTVVFNNLRPLIQSTNPEDINTVARAVLQAFKGREGDLKGVLGNVGALARTLSGRGQRLARLVTDLNQLTQIVNSESVSIKAGLGRFTTLMESLARVTPTIRRVVDQLNSASTKFGGILARNKGNLNQEISDLAVLLRIVNRNLVPLDRIAKNLKEVLLATARSQSYGKWWNLYVVNFCPEVDFPDDIPIGVLFPNAKSCAPQ